MSCPSDSDTPFDPTQDMENLHESLKEAVNTYLDGALEIAASAAAAGFASIALKTLSRSQLVIQPQGSEAR